jgi:fatty acid desaturase
MFPEAWNIEHNRLHHYHLGEDKDPDLVQRNLEFLRQMDFLPLPAKYALVSGMAGIWKWFYYAPNTYKELKLSEFVRDGKEFPEGLKPTDATTVRAMLFPVDDAERSMNELVDVDDFFTKVLGPMFFSRFVMLPAPLLLVPGVGPSLFGHALINLMLADLATNFHGFLTIVTNHAGEDVYAFDDEVKPKSGAFYVRQIVGSVNYEAGTDIVDFSHGWLNYQIEHQYVLFLLRSLVLVCQRLTDGRTRSPHRALLTLLSPFVPLPLVCGPT